MSWHGLPPACLVLRRLQREVSYFALTEHWCRSRKLGTGATSFINGQNHPPGLRYTRRNVSSNAASETSDALSKGGPLTLLHKTSSLISHVLPPKEHIDGQNPILSFEFWDRLLAGARDDLSALPKERKTRLVVHGVDEWSGTQDLVNALLQDPLQADADGAQGNVLRLRWKDREKNKPLIIEPASSSIDADGSVHLASAFLQQFSQPISVVEINGSPGETFILKATPLFSADIPIVVLNPLTIHLPAFLQRANLPLHNPNTILVVNSAAPSSEVVAHLAGLLSLRSHQLHLPNPRVLFINPRRMAASLEILSTNTKSDSTIQSHLNDLSESQLPTLVDALQEILEKPASTIRMQTALSRIRGAFLACRKRLAQLNKETQVFDRVCELRQTAEREKERLKRDLFGWDGDDVSKALASAEKDVGRTLGSLSWWRIMCRVDDTGMTVRTALEAAWCKDLERNLILNTGRLRSLQQSLSSETLELLSNVPATSPFHSALLLNSLRQLATSPSFALTPSTLTAPLHSRQHQLATFSTTRLHLAAQQTVLATLVSMPVGAGVGYCGWVGLFGHAMDAGTSLGMGMLGTLFVVRWAVGRWEKAKVRWWEDWARVSAGLQRDLRTGFDGVWRDQVMVVSRHAASSLNDMINKQQEKVGVIEEDLEKLEQELVDVEAQVASKKDNSRDRK